MQKPLFVLSSCRDPKPTPADWLIRDSFSPYLPTPFLLMLWHVQEGCSLWVLSGESPIPLCFSLFASVFLFAGISPCMLLKTRDSQQTVLHYSSNFCRVPVGKCTLLVGSTHQQTSSGQKRRHWLLADDSPVKSWMLEPPLSRIWSEE